MPFERRRLRDTALANTPVPELRVPSGASAAGSSRVGLRAKNQLTLPDRIADALDAHPDDVVKAYLREEHDAWGE